MKDRNGKANGNIEQVLNNILHDNRNIYIVYEYLGQPAIEIQGVKLGLNNFVTGPTEKGFVLGEFVILA